MLGGIAGQGGFDSKGKTPYVVGGITSATTSNPATLISVSGSGYLQSVSVGGVTSYGYLSVTIDGVAKCTNLRVSNGSSASGLALNFRFESSLLVKYAGSNTDAAFASASYLLD